MAVLCGTSWFSILFIVARIWLLKIGSISLSRNFHYCQISQQYIIPLHRALTNCLLSNSVLNPLIICKKMEYLLLELYFRLAFSFCLAFWQVMLHEGDLELKKLNKITICKKASLERRIWIEVRLLNGVNWTTVYSIQSYPLYTIQSIQDFFCFTVSLRC